MKYFFQSDFARDFFSRIISHAFSRIISHFFSFFSHAFSCLVSFFFRAACLTNGVTRSVTLSPDSPAQPPTFQKSGMGFFFLKPDRRPRLTGPQKVLSIMPRGPAFLRKAAAKLRAIRGSSPILGTFFGAKGGMVRGQKKIRPS